MACPLFVPSSPLGDLVSIAAPLGDLYAGHCSADPAAPVDPDTLRRFCNFGYARGHCERAAQSEADAVRLLVRADDGQAVEVAWSVERDHHPVAVGVESVQIGVDGPAATAFLSQVRACASSYVRQIHSRPAFPGPTALTAHP